LWLRSSRLKILILQRSSGGNLFKGKARDVGALAGVFDSDAQDAAVFVPVESSLSHCIKTRHGLGLFRENHHSVEQRRGSEGAADPPAALSGNDCA
jgi:hypothetical protein